MHVGDKVKVYKQKGAHDKEVTGDYKYHAARITGIEKSLGQTFYKVAGEGKPFLRSDILLINESEDRPQQPPPVPPASDEPYMSYKRKRIIQREARKAAKEKREKEKADAKAAVKQAKEEGKAKEAEGLEGEAKAVEDWVVVEMAMGVEEKVAVEKVAAFSQKLREPVEKFDAAKWKQVNEEIGSFRKRVGTADVDRGRERITST